MTLQTSFLSKYARIPPSSAGRMNGLPSPLGGLCHNEGNGMFVILNPSPYVTLERSEGSRFLAQGKLREESHGVNKLENRDSSANASE